MTDTLLNRIPREKLTPDEQASWDFLQDTTGDSTIYEVYANSPKASKFFLSFYSDLLFGGDVQRRYKELIRYRLSLKHGCFTCNTANRVSLKEIGVSQAEIEAVDDYENGPFSDTDKAAMALADELCLTNAGGTLTPELYARLKKHFSDGDIVEMSLVGALLGGMNKMAFVLDVVIKEDVCPFAPRHAAD